MYLTAMHALLISFSDCLERCSNACSHFKVRSDMIGNGESLYVMERAYGRLIGPMIFAILRRT